MCGCRTQSSSIPSINQLFIPLAGRRDLLVFFRFRKHTLRSLLPSVRIKLHAKIYNFSHLFAMKHLTVWYGTSYSMVWTIESTMWDKKQNSKPKNKDPLILQNNPAG